MLDPAEPRTYRVLGMLGRGSLGPVYRGRPIGVTLANDVLLEIVDGPDPVWLAERRERAKHLARLREPVLVREDPPMFLGVDRWALVREMVDGCTLENILAANIEVPTVVAVTIVGLVADVLHRVGIPHGAIEAASIGVSTGGEIKLEGVGARPGVSPDKDVLALGGVLAEMVLAVADPMAGRARALADEMGRGALTLRDVFPRCEAICRLGEPQSIAQWARQVSLIAAPSLAPDTMTGTHITERPPPDPTSHEWETDPFPDDGETAPRGTEGFIAPDADPEEPTWLPHDDLGEPTTDIKPSADRETIPQPEPTPSPPMQQHEGFSPASERPTEVEEYDEQAYVAPEPPPDVGPVVIPLTPEPAPADRLRPPPPAQSTSSSGPSMAPIALVVVGALLLLGGGLAMAGIAGVAWSLRGSLATPEVPDPVPTITPPGSKGVAQPVVAAATGTAASQRDLEVGLGRAAVLKLDVKADSFAIEPELPLTSLPPFLVISAVESGLFTLTVDHQGGQWVQTLSVPRTWAIDPRGAAMVDAAETMAVTVGEGVLCSLDRPTDAAVLVDPSRASATYLDTRTWVLTAHEEGVVDVVFDRGGSVPRVITLDSTPTAVAAVARGCDQAAKEPLRLPLGLELAIPLDHPATLIHVANDGVVTAAASEGKPKTLLLRGTNRGSSLVAVADGRGGRWVTRVVVD